MSGVVAEMSEHGNDSLRQTRYISRLNPVDKLDVLRQLRTRNPD